MKKSIILSAAVLATGVIGTALATDTVALFGTANIFTASNTFAEVHPTVENVILSSNAYTAVSADCGKMKVLPTGTTPVVHLFNINAGCNITFVTSVAISYLFDCPSCTVRNSQGFFHTRGTNAGDTVSVGIITPSGSAAVWVAVGDLTS